MIWIYNIIYNINEILYWINGEDYCIINTKNNSILFLSILKLHISFTWRLNDLLILIPFFVSLFISHSIINKYK